MRIWKKATDNLAQPGDKFLVSNQGDNITKNLLLSQIEEYILGIQGDRKIPIISQLDFTTSEPVLVNGERYINTVTGTSSLTSKSVSQNHIYECRDADSGLWYDITPLEGWAVWDKALDKMLFFNGTSWNQERGIGIVQSFDITSTVSGLILSNIPSSAYKHQVFKNGLLLKETTDYVISGAYISFTTDLVSSDWVIIYYSDVDSPNVSDGYTVESFTATAAQTSFVVSAGAITNDGLWSVQVNSELWNSQTGITGFADGLISINFATGEITFDDPLRAGDHVIIKYK